MDITRATPRKYFLYVRKSTDDTSHQMRSIDDQIAELREVARKESLDVVEVLIERQSAKKPGRPVFGEMIARIQKGDANAILAWHPDRLARNAVDGGQIIHLLDEKVLVDLRFALMPFDPSASGKFTLQIMFGQSKYYVDNLAENIKRGQRRKLAEGVWPALSPIGYLNDKQRKTLIVDPVRGPLVREVFSLYSSGLYTLDQITQAAHTLELRNRQGELLSRSQIHRLLTHPMYCGIIAWGGQTVEGQHEPLITKEVFDKVQLVVSRKGKPRKPRLKPYLYRGVFRCGECGCIVTTETKKGHNYLRCTKRVKKDCSQRYVREDDINRQVAVAIESVALPVTIADAVIAAFRDKQKSGESEAAASTAAAQAACRELDVKLMRLTDAFMAQVLTLDEFRDTRARLVAEKQTAKDTIAAAEANRAGWFEPAIRFVNASKQATFLALTGTDVEKREFLRKAGSNLTLRDRKLVVEPRGAWKTVANQGVLVHDEKAASLCDAAFPHGESHRDSKRRCPDFARIARESPGQTLD